MTVDDVSFNYPRSSQAALSHVSLEINEGQVVALVGENGSGKTTLAKLLAGLYQPSEGTIRWDDIDVSSNAPERIQGSVGVIFQDFVKYMLSSAGEHHRWTMGGRG